MPSALQVRSVAGADFQVTCAPTQNTQNSLEKPGSVLFLAKHKKRKTGNHQRKKCEMRRQLK